jgi:hypothetical protein
MDQWLCALKVIGIDSVGIWLRLILVSMVDVPLRGRSEPGKCVPRGLDSRRPFYTPKKVALPTNIHSGSICCAGVITGEVFWY